MSWWRRLIRGRQMDQELDAALRFHTELQVAEKMRSGMSEDEARRSCRLAFGGLAQVEEDCRESRGTLWVGSVLQDLRFGLRQLRKSPGFTLTAVAMLALGVGANSAVFTLFDQVLLRMLPVQRPKELVRFEWTGAFHGSTSGFGGDVGNYFSYPMYKDLRDRNQVFAGVVATMLNKAAVSWQNQAETVDVEIVSGNYFEVLGLRPTAGRLFTQQDDTTENANPVLVLGFDYWKTRFGASREAIGKTALINGHPFTIVGVAPANFHSAIGGSKPGVFLPISMEAIAMPWMDVTREFDEPPVPLANAGGTVEARNDPGPVRNQLSASMARAAST